MGPVIILDHFLVDFNLAKMLKAGMMVNLKLFQMKINRVTTIPIMINRLAFKSTTKSEMANSQVGATLSIHIFTIIFQVILNKVLVICNTTLCLKCINIILRMEAIHPIYTKLLYQEVTINLFHICSISSMVEKET